MVGKKANRKADGSHADGTDNSWITREQTCILVRLVPLPYIEVELQWLEQLRNHEN